MLYILTNSIAKTTVTVTAKATATANIIATFTTTKLLIYLLL